MYTNSVSFTTSRVSFTTVSHCRIAPMMCVMAAAMVAAFAPPLMVGRPMVGRSSVRPQPAIRLAQGQTTVDELRGLVLPRTSTAQKTPEDRARIRKLIEGLERQGSAASYWDRVSLLESPALFNSFEVAYFDKSVDGGKDAAYAKATRPFGLKSKLLGMLFSLRFSFQHVVRPATVVNHVGFRFCGIPATVIAKGTFEALSAPDVQANNAKFNSTLREGSSVRITFDPPRVNIGSLTFELTGAAAQPPVGLCTTVRLSAARTLTTCAYHRLPLTAHSRAHVFPRSARAPSVPVSRRKGAPWSRRTRWALRLHPRRSRCRAGRQ